MEGKKSFRCFRYIYSIPGSIFSISSLTQGTKGPLSAASAQCHWEVKAGRIRKGREQGSLLQGNKGKPIPPGIILILETQGSPASGSMGLSGEEKEGGGDQSRILHQRKCATLCPNYPQSCKESCYLFRCFRLNVYLLALAVCPCHTYQACGFVTSIAYYSDTELSNKLCSPEVHHTT